MQIILQEDIDKLGNRGDVVTVKPGYARNFLLPRKPGENDQMFGSVTSADIAEGLAAQGFKIDKRQVQLAEPVKVIGESQVTIKVFRDVTAQIKVTVEKES